MAALAEVNDIGDQFPMSMGAIHRVLRLEQESYSRDIIGRQYIYIL